MWPAKVVVREANRKRHKAANVTSVVYSRDPNASNCCNSELKCGILSLKLSLWEILLCLQYLLLWCSMGLFLYFYRLQQQLKNYDIWWITPSV